MNDKRSTPSVIAAYRKRQERAERLLLIFWVGIMLLVLGAGYLIYRFLRPGASPQAVIVTGTPGLTQTIALSAAPSTTPAPRASQSPDLTVTLAPSEIPPTASIITYTVKQGETLTGIATGFGTNLATLVALNPSITPEFLNVGDQLSVPAQGDRLSTATPTPSGPQTIVEYRVAAGDTLAGIAARFGSSVDAIVRENSLASPDQIQDGQTLRIPVAAGTASPAAPQSPTPTPAP